MEDRAYSYIFYDILGRVMKLSDNPSQFAEYLSIQIREFIGTRTVVIAIKDKNDEAAIYNVFPTRKKEWSEQFEVLKLAEHSFTLDKVKILSHIGEDKYSAQLLNQLEIEEAIAIPLIAGERMVGSILLLDIMDMLGIDSVLDILQRLSGVFALIIRNSLLYHNLEELVELRTKELQKRNEELIEREFQLKSANEEYESLNEELVENIKKSDVINNELRIEKQKVEKSEERFRRTIENSPIPTVIANNNRNIIYINKQFIQSYGYSIQEISSLDKCFELVYPDPEYRNYVNKDWANEVEYSIKNNIPTKFKEYDVTCKNGEIKNVSISAYFEKDMSIILFQDITEKKKSIAALQQIEWMLSGNKTPIIDNTSEYGDLSKLNKNGLILTSIGTKQLTQIASEYLDLLETSSAIYEKNGDYALGLFSSSWCQKMDKASRALCNTSNNQEALNCGKWLCHESCWNDASKNAIETGKHIDIECNGGIRLYAVPIFVNGEVVGAINFGYGEPPNTDIELQKLADLYKISVDELKKARKEYQVRPKYIIDYAKKRIQISAQYIGNLIERKKALEEFFRAKEKTEASEERFNLAMKASNDGLFDWNLETNEIYYSPGWKQMLGYQEHELPNDFSVWEKTTNPDDVKRSWELQQKLISKQIDKFVIEFKMKHKEGHWVDILARAEALFNENGVATRIVGTHTDISQRKQIEEALKESDWKFKALFEKGPIGVAYHSMVYDNTGKPIDYFFLDANQTYLELTGVDPRGKYVTEAFPGIENDPFDWIGVYGKVARTGESIRFEQYLEANKRWYDCVGFQYKPDHFVAAFLDITKRKQAEEALRISESIKNAMVSNISDVIVIIDENGNNKYKSPNVTKLFGWTPEELVGKNALFNIHPDDIDIAQKSLQTIYSEHNAFVKTEIRYLCKNGSYAWIEIAIINLLNDKDIKGILGNYHDISERKKAEMDLVAAKEKAEESDRLKTAFLQNISHEIRTPMNAIMGFSSLLPTNFNNKEKLQSFADIINQRCNDLLCIINDILDISKIESGQNLIIIDQCNINDLFSELQLFFADYQYRLNKQHIELSFQLLKNESFNLIKTDKLKLKQILINLITNAFKFTENGSIKCGVKLQNNMLQFYVSDTGIGIPVDKIDYIFQRFAQIKNNKLLNIGGTGLGLPIAKGLVELLGGHIWVDSITNAGSTFHFTIDYLTSEETKKLEHVVTDNIENTVKNKTILIVEDDDYNAMYLEEILDNYYSICIVNLGLDAINYIQNHKVDIVLMDVRLPDISGYEATKTILKKYPHIKVIAQTAYAAYDERLKALDAGCDDYISKPIDQKKLLDILNKY